MDQETPTNDVQFNSLNGNLMELSINALSLFVDRKDCRTHLQLRTAGQQ
jgi:tRNA splicing ligase